MAAQSLWQAAWPSGYMSAVEFGTKAQAVACSGAGSQADDDLVAAQGALAPVHRDE